MAHTFFFLWLKNFFFFFFFYQNLSIYILHLVEVFCSVYHFKVFYSKITEIQLVLIHISLSYFGTHFPSFGNTIMFHQPSDPSLLDTVVYGLVKGNKNNFNVGLIIWQSYELLHDKNNKMTCAPSEDCTERVAKSTRFFMRTATTRLGKCQGWSVSSLCA